MTTLRYEGMRFGPHFVSKSLNHLNKVDNFGNKFSNIGSLVIRFQLGQAQRAALLQEISLENYKANPIYQVNQGNNQEGLFDPSQGASKTRKNTSKLAKFAHGTLGVGKVLNERRQAQKVKNTQRLGGEALIWDIMHSTVWQVGTNLSPQLGKQGFIYISSPKNDDPVKHQLISEALAKGDFILKDGKIFVCGEVLQTTLLQKLKIALNRNEFVITGKDIVDDIPVGSLGWIMHQEKREILKPELTDDIFRIMKIAEGGFHRLNDVEQHFLMSGLVKETNNTTVTQNAAFNGLFLIASELNERYGFDPDLLFGNGLSLVNKRITEHFKANSDNLDDFLTGYLLNEMVQSLRTSKKMSKREVAPKNFINSFKYTANNNKAFAYAFDILDSNQNPVFRSNGNQPIGTDPQLIDVAMNGELALPTLFSGKHSGAILATSLLVGEQMLLEQLLREAHQLGRIKELLIEIVGEDSEELTQTAAILETQISQLRHNEQGPIIGLQYQECEKIIETLRTLLNFNVLIDFNKQLSQPGVKTQNIVKKNMSMDLENYKYVPDVSLNPDIQNGLSNLYRLGKMIQAHEGISAAPEGSRGINAGLVPLIIKLSPDLSRKLGLSLRENEYWANDLDNQGRISKIFSKFSKYLRF